MDCLDRRTRIAKQLDGLIDTIRTITPTAKVLTQTVRVDLNAFETAHLNGDVVVQGPRSPARDDLNALFSEVLADMVVSINRQEQRFSQNKSTEVDNEAEAVNG